MKDLHCHVMHGIDDGSRTIEESMEMLKKLEKEGTTDIILTPHYIENTNYIADNETKIELYNEIYYEAKKQNLNINIYLGNEVMVNNNLLKQLDTEILKLNNSRYLLIESTMGKEYPDLDIIVNELIENNITPIIAHPERYSFVKNDYKWVIPYIEMGALFQGDYESLFGKYGNKANKTLRKLLKHNLIHFLGSDMHRKESTLHTKEVKSVLKKIIKDDKKIEDILNNNFDKVIKNETI